MTPEQICLSFLKAVEKADLKAKEEGKPFICSTITAAGKTREYHGRNGYSESEYYSYILKVELWIDKEGGRSIYYRDIIDLDIANKNHYEETATRLLSMIKELEVYGIKIEKA